jgi:hypothetical protein
LPRFAYLPLIQQEERRLSGWQANRLSIGGRLTLMNSVLTSQPIYFMSIFLLPKWVINKLDRIRRRFHWHGHKEAQGLQRPICLVKWCLVTRSRQMGGLGVKELRSMNEALLLKWMWWWIQSDQAWWKMSNASRFWSSLRSITEIFNVSIKFQLGQGETIQFWHDDWLQGPLKLQFPYLYSQARYRDISIKHPYQQGQWQVHTQPILTQQAQLELIILHQKLSNVQMGMTTDEVLWTRNFDWLFQGKVSLSVHHKHPTCTG